MRIPLILDLETAPLPDADQWLRPLAAPGNYTKPESIAKWLDENRGDWLDKAALSPWAGRVVALGMVSAESGERTIGLATNGDQHEVDLIRECWARLYEDYRAHPASDVVCGFTVRGFDLPFLIARSRLLGIKVPACVNLARYGRGNVCDLADVLTVDRALDLRTLGFYARRFGLTTDEAISDGSEVPARVAAGDWDWVRAHLEQDLQWTRGLAERLL